MTIHRTKTPEKLVSNTMIIYHLKKKIQNRDEIIRKKNETIQALYRVNQGRL